MNFVALRMLTGDRAKYFGLVFAIAFCTFLLENQTSIFASIMRRTGRLVPGDRLGPGRSRERTDPRAPLVGFRDGSAPFLRVPIRPARYSEAVNFLGRERTQLSFIIAGPLPGTSPAELAERIAARTSLRARTTQQFMWDGIGYYLRNTGIPGNFGITILVALIVGTVVAGQTFYLFTVENLKQFGALKAMGVTNPRLVGMILLQAVSDAV